MLKITKQIIRRMIIALLFFIISIASIIIMIELDSDNTFINVLGIILFIVPAIISISLLIKLYAPTSLRNMLKLGLKNFQSDKLCYITKNKSQNSMTYINNTIRYLEKDKYKKDKVLILEYDEYNFYLKKHYKKLDSTNIHIHIASIQNNDVNAYFNDITNGELTLTKNCYKGQYNAILAIACISDFAYDETIKKCLENVSYVRSTAIIKVIVDVLNSHVYLSDMPGITGARSKKLIVKYVLNETKRLNKCPYVPKENMDEETINNIKKRLEELDIKEFNKKEKVLKNEVVSTLNSKFTLIEDLEEKGLFKLYYKEDINNDLKVLEIDFTFDENENRYETYCVSKYKWSYPKIKKIDKEKTKAIKKEVFEFLKEQNFKFVEYVFSYQDNNFVKYDIDPFSDDKEDKKI